MSILGLVIFIAVMGGLCFLAYKAPFIPPTFKYIIYCVLALIVLIVCANAFGILGNLHQQVPKL